MTPSSDGARPRCVCALREMRWVDPFVLYRRFAEGPGSVLLESARAEGPTGRYSILARKPFLQFESKDRRFFVRMKGVLRQGTGDPFAELKRLLALYAASPDEGLPPFAGGAVGVVAYEAKNILEPHLPQRAVDDLGLPDLHFQFYDDGVVFDHAARRAFLCAHARSRREALRKLDGLGNSVAVSLKKRPRAPFCGVPARFAVRESMDRAEFTAKVEVIQRHIRRGDIFQANLSQRFSFPVLAPAAELYGRLKRVNPSSFFGLYDAGGFQVVSGSPERLVKLEGGRLEARPIAGTRPRGRTPREDAAQSLALLLSEKERAEHVMLVDLERNDLGRVAEYGSVCVDDLMTVEEYSHVKHIVSGIHAQLKSGLSAVDALRALFPGGTITGTPKVRCMEILDGLEPVVRGPYTGSLGYFSFTGDMDFNIIIRSLVVKDKTAHLQTGAGIVADSVPGKEYDETLYKAQGVLAAIFGGARARAFLARRGVAGSLS